MDARRPVRRTAEVSPTHGTCLNPPWEIPSRKIFRFMREMLFHSRAERAIVPRVWKRLPREAVGNWELKSAVKTAAESLSPDFGQGGRQERDEQHDETES